MLDSKNIPSEIQESIVETINQQLIKRGFPQVTIKHNKNDRYPELDIISEEFNTVPVIMKSIRIENNGGSINNKTKIILRDGDEVEVPYLSIWIPVHVSYNHFGGGSNGTGLFGYSCEIREDNKERIYIFTENISG